MASSPERLRTRFLVVGSGIAGLHTAWRASQHGDVLLLTKRSLFDSATAYAQGGIAAALGAGDSPTLHRRDTLAAGAALCDAAAVEVLVEEGPARVRELQTAGAEFDLDLLAEDPPLGDAIERIHRRGMVVEVAEDERANAVVSGRRILGNSREIHERSSRQVPRHATDSGVCARGASR